MHLAILLLARGPIANAALVFGGVLVGAVLARLITRRQQEVLRGAEQRAYGLRIRALEASRLEAIAELGRAADELARRALGDGRKAPRRTTVGPRQGGSPQFLPGVGYASFIGARDDRSLGATLGGNDDGLPGLELAPPLRLKPLEVAPPVAAEDPILTLLRASSKPGLDLDVSLGPDGEFTLSAPSAESARSRAESWSIPLVPLPRR
ncbi:MAG: hypothetical protein R3F49_05955 [Planctomycetota bacterium]